MQDTLPVVLFASVSETTPESDDLSLAALTDPSEWIPATNKADAPLYSPALYGEGATRAKGDTGPSHLTALVLDYDDGETTPDAAFAAWDGFERYLHSTYSHTPAHPKYRLILPLAAPVPAHEWAAFWALAAQVSEGVVDGQCKDPTRMFYAPSRPVGREYIPLVMRETGARLAFADLMLRDPTDRPARRERPSLRVVSTTPAAARGSGGLFSEIGDDRRKIRAETTHEALAAVCPVMAHAAEHPDQITEPVWRAQLSLLIRCEGGEELAHELSSAHPNYDPDETQGKIDRLRDVGPFTRSAIEHTDEGARLCPSCPQYDACGSRGGPLNLARAEHVPEGAESEGVERARLREKLEAEVKLLEQARIVRDHAANPDVKAEAAADVVERSAVVTATKQRLAKVTRQIERAAQRTEAAPDDVDADTWSSLDLGRDETPRVTDRNLLRVFEGDPRYSGLAFDELRRAVVDTTGKLDGALLDFGDPGTGGEVLRDLADRYRMATVSFGALVGPLVAAARRSPFHPVQTWLEALPAWDGNDRTSEACDLLGAERDAAGLHGEYLRRTLIAAVARVFDPGCKVDTMLVLQGEQGIGKSSGLQTLFEGASLGGWFSSTTVDLQSKDARLAIHRAWITEFAELAALGKRDSETIKAFMTERSDFYREPYGRAVIERKRRCLFVGSTNEEGFLRDPTGSRRFWVLPITRRADLDGLLRVREQVFAQALHEYAHGAPHWLDKTLEAEQRRVNAARWQTPDPVFEALLPWFHALEVGSEVKVRDAAQRAGIIGPALNQAAAKHVASVLRRLGFERRHTRQGNVWRKPGSTA